MRVSKRNLWSTIAIVLIGVFLPMVSFAQDHHGGDSANTLKTWFGVLELPFLILCIFFAFKTAAALKGGTFGKGMNLLAWGFLVMAVGHLHMQIEHFMGINIFNELLGNTLGTIAWFIALVVTWGLSGLGFYTIYKSSKG